MGTSWTVWPLSEEMANWLDDTGTPYPSAPSRFPTGKEIKAVLGDLHDFDIRINDNGIGRTWQAHVTSKAGGDVGEWTLLNVLEYTGDDEEQQLYFEKGWESLITRILRDLTARCGPLVLIADSDGTPNVIKP